MAGNEKAPAPPHIAPGRSRRGNTTLVHLDPTLHESIASWLEQGVVILRHLDPISRETVAKWIEGKYRTQEQRLAEIEGRIASDGGTDYSIGQAKFYRTLLGVVKQLAYMIRTEALHD